MIGAVIGIGPRTGTSYVMKSLHEAGFATYWEEDDHPDKGGQIGGHFECPVDRLPQLENVIVKVWPGAQDKALIERAVILSRPVTQQLPAIAAQMARERTTGITPEEILNFCMAEGMKLRIPNVIHVTTPNIDREMGRIKSFFMEGLYHGDCSDSCRSHWGSWNRH